VSQSEGPLVLQRAGCITMTPLINAVNYGAVSSPSTDYRTNEKGGEAALRTPAMRSWPIFRLLAVKAGGDGQR
jgi:hypothetical protein